MIKNSIILYVRNNLVLVVSFVWLMISGLFSFTDLSFFIGVFVLTIFFSIYFYSLTSRVSKKYALNGSSIDRYSCPAPLTSIFNSLKMRDYTVMDINKIDFMAHNLTQSCKYGERAITKMIQSNSNIQLNIVGHGTSMECKEKNKEHINNVFYFATKKENTEHKNLIYMNDGKTFLWYEPYHTIENGQHNFKEGGYFVEPSEKTIDSITKEFSKLKES